jgi:hypothetical protein
MSPQLKIGSGAGEVRPADVQELITQLLDDKSVREGYRRGLYGERMAELDTARCVADGRLSLTSLSGGGGGGGGTAATPIASAVSVVGRPMALSDGLLMINHTTALLRAYDTSPTWPAYKAGAPPFPDEIQRTMVRHLLAKMMLPSFDHAAQVSFRHIAERRMTAVALAIRLYAIDHDGKRPAKLEDLVPQYLPAVPLDPFAPTPQALRYINDPTNPVVYSISDDGMDGGGSEVSARPSAHRQNEGRWDKLDAVLHLTLQPREKPKEEAEAAITPDDTPEIYPNEKEIRAAATRAATTTASPANAPGK